MRTRTRKLRLLCWLAGVAAAFFFVTAVAGWLRERHEVRIQREEFQRLEVSLWERIDQVKEGASLDAFKAAFPNAYEDRANGEWSVRIPTGYDESAYCTNYPYKVRYFKIEGDIVKLDESQVAVGAKHIDSFGYGGPWYYFWRAWRSSLEPEEEPSDAQK